MKVVFLCLVVLLMASAKQLPYKPCPMKSGTENRRLFVATCDTRIAWKEFMALRLWNVTGEPLRNNGVSMINVCKGENWGKLGFLTKPLIYLKYLKSIVEKYTDNQLNHVILMDSDTFWSVTDVKKVWNKYDCARGTKSAVLSTEMSCWVGRYCVDDDIKRWYNRTGGYPSYSPFANSGVVMGQINTVMDMLQYVVVNNASYFTTYHKLKFDDQYAIADYAINIAPQHFELDYHQQIAASCSIHAPGDPPDEGWPFVCQDRNGTMAKSCHIYTNLMRKVGYFEVSKYTCMAVRKTWDNMPLQWEMESMSNEPLIWHGNGQCFLLVIADQ